MIPLSFSSYKPLDKFSPSTSPPHSKTKTPFLLIKSQIKILKHIKVFAFRPHPKYFSWKNSSILPFKHGIPTSLSFYSNSPTTKPNQNSRVSFPVFPLNQSGNRSKTGGPKLTMMLEMCRRPLEKCFGGGDGGDGLLWHMDLKPHSSGDYSIAVVQANSALEDQGQVFTSPCATYVGVYDGHGGPEASRFITNRLFPFLHKFATEQGGLSEDVIRKAFDATEEEFLELVKRSWMVRPQIASVGSCCLVGAIADGLLHVANLGDSRAVLGRRSSDGQAVVAERLSTDHNVAVEEVRKEVKDLHPDDAHIVVFTRGVWRIKGIIQHIVRGHEPRPRKSCSD